MKQNIILALLLMAMISCNNVRKSEPLLSGNLDTLILKKDIYLFTKDITDSSYMAIWGKDIKKLNYDTLTIFPSGKPSIEWHNDDFISLRQGCGSACYFSYILSLNSNVVKTIMYPVAYDTVNNLIAYSPDDGNQDVLLIIENLLTGSKQEILQKFEHNPVSCFAIDSIKFIENGLFVRWRDRNSQLVEKVFR